jgi:hypothetical protein
LAKGAENSPSQEALQEEERQEDIAEALQDLAEGLMKPLLLFRK